MVEISKYKTLDPSNYEASTSKSKFLNVFFFSGWIAKVIQNHKKDNPNKLIIANKIKMTDQIDMISLKILLYFGLYQNHLRRWSI